jgi:hypothetical protein
MKSLQRIFVLKKTFLPMTWCVFLAAARLFAGTTYYVAPAPLGDDAHNGMISSPWHTIQKAATTMLPGDTVLIRAGTYSEMVSIKNSGLEGRKITYKNYPGEFPVIDGTGVGTGEWGSLLEVNGAHYVNVEGLEVKNSMGYGVVATDNFSHVDFSGMNIHNNAKSGLMFDKDTIPAYSSIKHSTLSANGWNGILIWCAPGGYFVIEDNTVLENRGSYNYDGIQV